MFRFVGGKGGVGKTTCAAVAALRLASFDSGSGRPEQHRRATARGNRSTNTLLITTDPASSLAAALDTTVTAEPRPVRGAKGLFAANIDASAAFARWLAPRKPLVAQIAVRGTYLDDEDVGRLLTLSLPGIDEVIGLVEIVRLAAEFDAVVVDTAPTGHTLRLLASPVLLQRVAALLDGLQAHHRAVVSALRGSYRADAADAFIGDLHGEAERLMALLRDPATTIEWVTLPEPMALEETADAIGVLAANGIAVNRLIVNRVTAPPPQPCAWCAARRRFEARALAPVRRRFPALPVSSYPEVEREPRGVRALIALGRQREPWDAAAPVAAVAHRVRAQIAHQGGATHRVFKGTVGGLFFGGGKTAGVPVFPRWLLFGGKGGVGKSTCAAAVALRLAADRRVLLLSTDPAHSLGDVFGQRFDNTPRPAAGEPQLHVREIDAAAEMARLRRTYVDAVDEAFARIARGAGGDQEAFRDLIDLAPPGIDEVIAIADVAETLTAAAPDYDVVVTDTAPTGHALRLLQTPAVLRQWTQALMALLLKYREIVGAGSLAALLVRLSKRLRGLQDALADSARARCIVVTRPAALPSGESRELMAALDRLGIAVGGIIVNAVGRGDCTRCRAIARAQTAEVQRLAARGSYAIIEAPAEVPPPHGSRVLKAWGSHWRQLR